MTVIYSNNFAYRMESYPRAASLQTNLQMTFHSTRPGHTPSSEGKSLSDSAAGDTNLAAGLNRVILQYRFCNLNSPKQKEDLNLFLLKGHS